MSFCHDSFRNPTRDNDGDLAWLLYHQYCAYKNTDPKEKHEKATPACILSRIATNDTTETKRAITELTIGAFFFACRSCEYLKVPRPHDKRTRILTLRNIAFYKDGKAMLKPSPSAQNQLHTADSVSITFETQKNERKFDTITQWRTSDPTLCPVKQWAALTVRIYKYPGATDSTPISAVWHHNCLDHIEATEVSNTLKDAVKAHGEDDLQIYQHKIGTHSIRSGAAMAMYLGGVPVFAIMMIGRWSSDSFMKYIRKQIEEFTFDVSSKMLTMQHFRHVPIHSPGDSRRTEYGGSASLMIGSKSGVGITHPANQGPGAGVISY